MRIGSWGERRKPPLSQYRDLIIAEAILNAFSLELEFSFAGKCSL